MTVDPGIVAVFGEAPDNVNLNDNSASQDKAAILALFIMACISVALRLYARFLQGSKPFWDDWIILLTLAFVGGTAGLAIVGGHHGAGQHVWALKVADLVYVYKILYAYTFLYASACAASKISILFFYIRIFRTQNASFRYSAYFGYFLSFSYPVIIMITMGNACRPVTHFWTQFSGTAGRCIDVSKFFFALGVINMLNDIIILCIPIPQIFALQMSLRKRLAVTGIMMLGGFVCAASAVRIYYLTRLSRTIDLTSAMGPIFIWSEIEPSLAIVSACLPHLVPLRQIVVKKITSRFGSSGNSAVQSTTGRSKRTGPWNVSTKRHENDDEIMLTTMVAGGKAMTFRSEGSGSAENVGLPAGYIGVQSTLTQTSAPRGAGDAATAQNS